MSNELAKNTATIKELIGGDKFKTELAKTLPKHLSPERFARVAITALTRTPKLAQCTQTSLFKCLLDLSAVGLEPDGRRAHLIPYKDEATLIIDYKGLVELIRRSGEVTALRAETVCEKDEFEWFNGEVKHRINWREPRGKLQAVYAEARMKSGEVQTATMTIEEVEAIRKQSKSGNKGPWVDHYPEMAKKSVLRRLSKMLSLSYEVSEAIDSVDKPIDFNNGMRDVTPESPSAFDDFKQLVEADDPVTEDVEIVTNENIDKVKRETLPVDWVQAIEGQLLEADKSEKAFLQAIRDEHPDCNAESLKELTIDEAKTGQVALGLG